MTAITPGFRLRFLGFAARHAGLTAGLELRQEPVEGARHAARV